MVGLHEISLSWELSVVVKNTHSVKWSLLWYNSAIVLARDSCVCLSCRCKRCEIPWSRKWQPTSVFLPGKFHGQRSLVGYSPWGHKELNMTEWLSTHTHNMGVSRGRLDTANNPFIIIFIEQFCYTKEVFKSHSSKTHRAARDVKWWGSLGRFVTQSKLILLATWQANKSRDKSLGWGIVTLFGKPANPRRWWTQVPKKHLNLS